MTQSNSFPNLFNVADQVILVSGGSRGIGFAIAESFAQQGAKVIITGRDESALKAACNNVENVPHSLSYQTCDVADEKIIASCVDKIIADYGHIDCLINCAGVNKRMPALEYSAAEFDQIMDINLRGAFLMSQAVGKKMVERGSGNQINIDSLSTHLPLPQILPYAMSKAGLSNMTRGMALEWGKHGVRVNAIAPGFILTDLTKKMWDNENMLAWHKVTTPLQHMGQVVDLVGTAIFLASKGASFITGQIIRVDGGASAGTNWPIAGDFEVTNLD